MAVGGGAVIEVEMMDYVVDCKNKRLTGDPAHPDQAVLKVK
jgi:hypothetical protein